MEKVQFFLFFPLLYICKVSYAADTLSPKEFITDGQELISSRGSFTLGFFSSGSSQKRYLGIWYGNIKPPTIVWVANRENPLNDTKGQLNIGAEGNLLLFDGSKSIIWSTGLSATLKEPNAKLLDSGNLVLTDERNGGFSSYIWQSFDYPSDTLIPGMKLGWDANTGLNRYLSSRKSDNDPSAGDFTYSFDHGELPRVTLRREMSIVFRGGIWNGISFNSDYMKSFNALSRVVTITNNEVSYRDEPRGILTRLVLHYNGSAQRYLWDDHTMEWNVIYDVRRDLCDQLCLL